MTSSPALPHTASHTTIFSIVAPQHRFPKQTLSLTPTAVSPWSPSSLCLHLGEVLPGSWQVCARGNALGKGPVLFCFSAEGLSQVKRLAAGKEMLGPAGWV